APRHRRRHPPQGRDRLLPGPASPPPAAGARSAHQDQRPHPQGPQAHRRRQEEVRPLSSPPTLARADRRPHRRRENPCLPRLARLLASASPAARRRRMSPRATPTSSPHSTTPSSPSPTPPVR